MVYVKASERRRQFVHAAREVMAREGVSGTTLRGVAAEADVPLGTLHYAFATKDLLMQAVIEDVMAEISEVLQATADVDGGLEHALRQGLDDYWQRMVVGKPQEQLMQHELLIHALRTPGMESLARWQMDRYCRIVAAWCQEAASNAAETCAVPFDTLARVIVAAVIGIVLQYVADPDERRSQEDLQATIEMVLAMAGVRPARRSARTAGRNGA
ncbi:TetR/AcrR family transcriptional regulator [Angustibacter luteus]|uniref:TetR/AcrR family transcriptional regulator n=1 Tax=Angustibacter luteus TaxID=658456 RepID=A0ABW1JCY1_9ACTN